MAAIAIILLSYSILAEAPEDSATPGMGDRYVYSSANLVIIVVSSFLIAIAVMFILLREEYEPLPPSLKPPQPEEGEAAAEESRQAAPEDSERAAPQPETGKPLDEGKRETYLILRLLSGDERRMFKAVMDAGGAALQKDLIKNTKMSNAKVSRVLDRLQEKGVITKARHGSTNMVRISVDEG
ncbi:MAG: hypothetical protein JSU93_03795 [Methanobacteriota archaeon]|nr:MAG: hypothetical protein JSU93_03795 [Euryarchaeota archaeon]